MDYLIGHLVGDYIFQTDWQANNKTWTNRKWTGLFIAHYHAALWTVAVLLADLIQHREITWPLWAIVAMWTIHALQDWTRFPTKLMNLRKQFVFFRDNMPQAYVWACIVVDNTIHLAMLFVFRSVSQ